MAKSGDVELALDQLIEMGVLSEAGLEHLGQMFRGIQALGGISSSPVRMLGRGKPRGRRPISQPWWRTLGRNVIYRSGD